MRTSCGLPRRAMTLIAAAVRGRFVSWRNRLAELFDACTRPTQANRDALFKLLSQALEVPGGATASSVPGVLRRPNLVRCEFEVQALENTLWQGGKAARQDSAKPGLSRRPAALACQHVTYLVRNCRPTFLQQDFSQPVRSVPVHVAPRRRQISKMARMIRPADC